MKWIKALLFLKGPSFCPVTMDFEIAPEIDKIHPVYTLWIQGKGDTEHS